MTVTGNYVSLGATFSNIRTPYCCNGGFTVNAIGGGLAPGTYQLVSGLNVDEPDPSRSAGPVQTSNVFNGLAGGCEIYSRRRQDHQYRLRRRQKDRRAFHVGLCCNEATISGYTPGLAWDLAPRKITVNTVEPGAIDTDMMPADSAVREAFTNAIPGIKYLILSPSKRGKYVFGKSYEFDSRRKLVKVPLQRKN